MTTNRRPSLIWRARGLLVVKSGAEALLAFVDQAVVSAANFIVILLIAQSSTNVEFGEFMLAYSVLMLTTAIANALFITPHNIIGSVMDPVDYARFTSELIVLISAVLCVACGACLVTAMILTHAGEVSIGAKLYQLAFVLVPWIIQEFIRRSFYVRSQIARALINDTVCCGSQVLLILYMRQISGLQLTSEHGFLAFGLSSAIGVLVGGYQLKALFRLPNLVEVWAAFVRTAKSGKWFLANALVYWFYGSGQDWLIFSMTSTADYGTYRAVVHLANAMNPLRQAANAYLLPRGSAVYNAEGSGGLVRWVKRYMIAIVAGFVPVCIGAIFVAQPVLDFLYPSVDTRYGATLLLLAVLAHGMNFARLPGDIAFSIMCPQRYFWIVVVMTASLLLLSFVLLRAFGIPGAPLAVIISSFLVVGYMLFHLRRSRDRVCAA
jgi:O-antigen/teichoic acid export membrane protein